MLIPPCSLAGARVGDLALMSSDWTEELQVFCVDVGSIARGNFAWARRHPGKGEVEVHDPASIESLLTALESHLTGSHPVALGFEMPMFLPVPRDPTRLGKARPTDIDAPPWSQATGACVMATGAVQAGWVLRRLWESAPDTLLFFQWEPFAASRSGLLLWEAFVSGSAKGRSHEDDAAIGLKSFCAQLPNPGDKEATEIEGSFSLIAALALWAGWDTSPKCLQEPGIIVRAH